MTLRNQISAAAGIPQKRSTAIFRKPMIRHPHSRDSVSVGFRTAAMPARKLTTMTMCVIVGDPSGRSRVATVPP